MFISPVFLFTPLLLMAFKLPFPISSRQRYHYIPEADFRGAISLAALFLEVAACRVQFEAFLGDI